LEKTALDFKCRICGGNQFKRVTGRSTWEIRACLFCTNASTFPLPISDRQYNDHPFFKYSIKDAYRWRLAAAGLIRFITKSCSRGSLLDVGSGGGFVIEEALAAGFQAQGIDASHLAVIYARSRGLPVQEGYFQDSSFSQSTFDVIIMNHVLEHVTDPRGLLIKAYNLIRPGGCLCLGQTNYLGTVPRIFGSYWYGWVPSEHYTHFSLSGISYLLKNIGFQIKATKITTLFWDWQRITALSFQHWPGAFLNNLAAFITRIKFGFPFVGDQFNILASRN